MRYLAFLSMLVLLITIAIFLGCETVNPLCSDTYCIEGEIYLKSDLEEGQTFDNMPGSVDEEMLINLLTVDVGEYDFQPITVTGKIDWDFLDDNWEYRENRVNYLKKVVLELTSDTDEFGENRIILVHLNKDTVEKDENSVEYVDFLGTASIHLTHHVGIATYKGDIVGAPTK